MLIQTRRELETNEIVVRKDFKEVPPRVEYSLTRSGVPLAESLRPLSTWGSKYVRGIATLSDRMP